MNVGTLMGLLANFPKGLPVRVLSTDGVEELPFGAPILTLENYLTEHEFVAINVVVTP